MAKNKPQIRFQGHQDEWEECKLEKLGTWKRGQALSKTDICSHGKNPCIHYAELFAYKEIIQQIKSRTDLPSIATSSGNDLLFPDSDVTPDGLGRCSALTEKGVILGGGINILELNEQYLAPYCSLNVVKNRKQIIEKVTGATVRHIHSKDLDEVSIYTTTDKLEQKKIGELFRTLDELIEAKEQELEKLRQIKLALLDGMFPSDEPDKLNRGGYNTLINNILQMDNQLYISTSELNVPVIRFRGFTEPWELRSFGYYGNISMCKRVMKYQTAEKGEVPFYKIGTFGHVADAYISKELFDNLKRNYPYPQKGDILISAAGTIGRTVEFSGNDEYFQDSNIVWLNHNNTIYNPFLKIIYSIVKWNGLEGSTLKRLYNNNILNTKFYIPSFAEQKKIGDFFSEQDENIRSAQLQINKLRNIKQACMQKMFA